MIERLGAGKTKTIIHRQEGKKRIQGRKEIGFELEGTAELQNYGLRRKREIRQVIVVSMMPK